MSEYKTNIGRMVEGNWGAMFPTDDGMIVDENVTHYEIFWDNDDLLTEMVEKGRIRNPGETSANGSPIGIYWVD